MDIVLPNVPVDATTTAASPIMEDFYSPNTTPDSFEVINGLLDKDNFGAGEAVKARHVQIETFTLGRMVGATANLDFFNDLFPYNKTGEDLEDTSTPVDVDTNYIPVPGAGFTFYLPWTPSWVCFSWNICLAIDARSHAGVWSAEQAQVKLFVNSNGIMSTKRRLPLSVNDATTPPTRLGAANDRRYSGHHTHTTLTKGWNSAGLRINSACRQLRTRVRAFRVIAVR